MSDCQRGSEDKALLLRANEDAAAFFRANLLADEGAGPRRYLAERGFEAVLGDTVWTVGYAPPGWTWLRDHLRQRGYGDQDLRDAGLVTETRNGMLIDRFRDRLTFGIRAPSGDLVAFTTRSAPRRNRHVPKYLNTPGTCLYDKGGVLLGLGEQSKRLAGGATPVLVEGPLDALAVDLCDTSRRRLAPLALCGLALTPAHALILSETAESAHVVVAFDRDPPGAKAAANAHARLHRYFTSVNAAELSPHQDPAEHLLAAGIDRLRSAVVGGPPLADRLIDDLRASYPDIATNAEARVACLRAASRIVITMDPQDVVRQAQRLPALLGLSQQTVTRELVSAVCPDPDASDSGWLAAPRLPRQLDRGATPTRLGR